MLRKEKLQGTHFRDLVVTVYPIFNDQVIFPLYLRVSYDSRNKQRLFP
jgi:hypothetical protein